MPVHHLSRRAFLGAALASAAGGVGFAQTPTERTVNPVDLPNDRGAVWNLHFKYRSPRIDVVGVVEPTGKVVQKTVWYMWFQVYNTTPDPQTFLPEFILVTKDPTAITENLDEPQPYIFDQLKKREDPTGVLNLQSTVSIAKRPVPPTGPDSIPRTVSGLAIFPNLAEKAPKTNRFSIYVLGLSNGLATEEVGTETVIKRKALRIDFFRPTDDVTARINDIRPDTRLGAAEKWVYRPTTRTTTGNPGAEGK